MFVSGERNVCLGREFVELRVDISGGGDVRWIMEVSTMEVSTKFQQWKFQQWKFQQRMQQHTGRDATTFSFCTQEGSRVMNFCIQNMGFI